VGGRAWVGGGGGGRQSVCAEAGARRRRTKRRERSSASLHLAPAPPAHLARTDDLAGLAVLETDATGDVVEATWVRAHRPNALLSANAAVYGYGDGEALLFVAKRRREAGPTQPNGRDQVLLPTDERTR